ncbi:MAG: outer membrane protein assembly factor BamB [Gammaproteobacteria bacterium]|nr:outer membrane protein assembly factor BamB [Gammaproteobacteria bacterium]
MRQLIWMPVLLALAGCGTVADPFSWFDSTEVVEPSPLVDLQNQVQPQQIWSRDIGAGTDEQSLNLSPRVVGDTVYVADAEGRVQALDAASGATRWQVDLDLPLSGGPGAGDGMVLIGTSDADVVALNVVDGSERWRVRVSSEVLSAPGAANGVVVVHTVDGKVFGLESTTGSERWRYEREVPVLTLRGSSSPVLAGGVAVVGMAGGKLVALRLANGSLVWDANVAVPTGRSELERLADIDGDPLILRGGVFAATYQGNVAALEQRGGRVAWQRKMSSYSGMAADGDGLYVADEEGVVWGLELRSGAVRWSQKALANRRLSNTAALGGLVVVGDFEGYLHWLDNKDGSLVARTRLGSEPITTGLQVVDGVLYVQGDGGQLAAVRLPR